MVLFGGDVLTDVMISVTWQVGESLSLVCMEMSVDFCKWPSLSYLFFYAGPFLAKQIV